MDTKLFKRLAQVTLPLAASTTVLDPLTYDPEQISFFGSVGRGALSDLGFMGGGALGGFLGLGAMLGLRGKIPSSKLATHATFLAPAIPAAVAGGIGGYHLGDNLFKNPDKWYKKTPEGSGYIKAIADTLKINK